MAGYPQARAVLKEKPVSSLPLVAVDGIPLWMGSLSYSYLVKELTKKGIMPVAR